MTEALQVVVRNAITKHIIESKPRTNALRATVPIQHPSESKAMTRNNVQNVVDAVRTIDGVHMDLFDYFDIDGGLVTENQSRKMRFVFDWAMKDSKTVASGLRKINRLDNRLGNNDMGDAKLIKIYNWLKLRNGNS